LIRNHFWGSISNISGSKFRGLHNKLVNFLFTRYKHKYITSQPFEIHQSLIMRKVKLNLFSLQNYTTFKIPAYKQTFTFKNILIGVSNKYLKFRKQKSQKKVFSGFRKPRFFEYFRHIKLPWYRRLKVNRKLQKQFKYIKNKKMVDFLKARFNFNISLAKRLRKQKFKVHSRGSGRKLKS